MTHLANKIRSIFGSFTNALIIQFQDNFSYKCKLRISHSIFRNKWSGILNIFWRIEQSLKYNMTNNNVAIKSMESIIESLSQCYLGYRNIALLEANNCLIPAFWDFVMIHLFVLEILGRRDSNHRNINGCVTESKLHEI